MMTDLKSDSKATRGSRQPNAHQVGGHLGVRNCGLSNPNTQQQHRSHLPLAGAPAGPHRLHHQRRRQNNQLAQLVESNAVYLQEWQMLALNGTLALLISSIERKVLQSSIFYCFASIPTWSSVQRSIKVLNYLAGLLKSLAVSC
jgi:hypothetical protein